MASSTSPKSAFHLFRCQYKHQQNFDMTFCNSNVFVHRRATTHSRIKSVVASISDKEQLQNKNKVFEPKSKTASGNGDRELISEINNLRKVGKKEWEWPPWKRLPTRYKLIGTTALAFVICNMDKVNLSVAIIPMSHQFGWNSSTAGLVQSSFFWGYALSQLPGGWLAKEFSGKKVLELGVLIWSFATALVPVAAGLIPGLIISRILVFPLQVPINLLKKVKPFILYHKEPDMIIQWKW
eukprot:TRINITY_DN10336_c0_g1_i1.p1 TRINITY_DN10336_c0_g1~~TRINITY_DN10336_c0_g1_i1.p1  ORF type:complete len:239 (-),score=29.74 TRINITY_DN10336_c0_g1_i1:92-808(-)